MQLKCWQRTRTDNGRANKKANEYKRCIITEKEIYMKCNFTLTRLRNFKCDNIYLIKMWKIEDTYTIRSINWYNNSKSKYRKMWFYFVVFYLFDIFYNNQHGTIIYPSLNHKMNIHELSLRTNSCVYQVHLKVLYSFFI